VGGYVYILASGPYGTLYVGVTSSLSRRVFEHREDVGSSFARKYGVHRLVHYEVFESIQMRSIARSG
jgi:putative endonuclease